MRFKTLQVAKIVLCIPCFSLIIQLFPYAIERTIVASSCTELIQLAQLYTASWVWWYPQIDYFLMHLCDQLERKLYFIRTMMLIDQFILSTLKSINISRVMEILYASISKGRNFVWDHLFYAGGLH